MKNTINESNTIKVLDPVEFLERILYHERMHLLVGKTYGEKANKWMKLEDLKRLYIH